MTTTIRASLMTALLGGVVLLLTAGPATVRAQNRSSLETPSHTPLEARVWLDRGMDPVLQAGDQAQVYYRASRDAYVSVLHIDTDGRIRFLLSEPSGTAVPMQGGRDHRVVFSGTDHWTVEESPGIGYFYVIASPVPLELGRIRTEASINAGSDATELFRVTQDPHLAVESVVNVMVPEGARDGFALDFTTYHVGQSYSYPRFMCYDCHTAESFDMWNPYRRTCPDVRVMIFSDPYYYPSTRYQGGRVMYPRPVRPVQPQFGFKERGPGEPGSPLVQVRSSFDATHRAVAGPSGGRDAGTDPMEEILRQLMGEPGTGGRPSNELRDLRVPAVFGPTDSAPANADRPVLRRRAVQEGEVGPD